MKLAGFIALSCFTAGVAIACGSSSDATTTAGDSDAAQSSNNDGATSVDSSSSQTKDTGAASTDANTITDAAADSAQNDYDAAACGYTTYCDVDGGAPPIDAGTLSGDTTPSGGNTITLSGRTSEWLTVRVTEDDHSAIGRALTLTATLTAPAGVNFDLYLYEQTDGSTNPECTNVSAQSTNAAGKSDGANLSWGEGTVANLGDDTETITVRVQRVSGECDLSNSWTLTLTGNTG